MKGREGGWEVKWRKCGEEGGVDIESNKYRYRWCFAYGIIVCCVYHMFLYKLGTGCV